MSTDNKKTKRQSTQKIASRFRIYPGIGIARVGNSPTEFFIGPETSGLAPDNNGSYKDAKGRIKRQAARFRIFEIDDNGTPIKEITFHDAKITWHVHLANKKASFFIFNGEYKEDKVLRNHKIQPHLHMDKRTDLIIDCGKKSISGLSEENVSCTGDIKFNLNQPINVKLGDLKTDKYGRLLVLGGAGFSKAVIPDAPIGSYANNDFWYDDTSDGVISATIQYDENETSFEAEQAHVIIAPPNFAPNVQNLIPLYDVMHEVAVDEGWLPGNTQVEFNRDILPILTHVTELSWVNENAHRGHGPGRPAHFLTPETLLKLSDHSTKSKLEREAIFSRIRKPYKLATEIERSEQACLYYMPQLSGNGGDATIGDPSTWLSFLKCQYLNLEKWAAGDFTTGKSTISKPINLLSPSDQALELERAALEVCVGGPFYPGIEMTYISAYKSTYKSPFRLSDDFGPGDVTKYMAIPWQADFFECNTHWWPAQRPDDVFPEMEYMSVLNSWNNESKDDTYAKSDPFADALGDHVQWARGLGKDIGTSHAGDDDMVKYWHELGFVVPKKAPNGEIVQVETEREKFAGLDVRELFYQLMNENYEALPKARQYVEDSLAAARDYMLQPDTPETWKPFKYSEQAFTARMNEIYNDMVNDVDRYDPATDATFRNRADIVERIKQFSPFNMSDGCWLRHMAKAGPMDHPHSLLFSVLMDEMGDGVVGHNHSNIYQDLCHSTGYYPYPMSSRKFAFDESLIESGFQLPVFELAASACTEAYFPELLGMTLQLEWGIYEAKKTIALLEYYGFDTHYYVMHVGIDNPSNGHAARAVEAISIYLDNVRAQHGGEQAVQEQWSRIWAGFVTFGTIGTFGQDLVNHLKDKPTLEAKMLQLITDKAAYGSLNHGDKKLGPNKINDWFSDPKGFLDEIQKSGLVVPGDWENSPMNALTSFSTGKMYRVFTPEELQLWIDWTNSLVDKIPPVGFDAKQNMIQLINILRQRQEGVEGHELARLKGPQQDEGKSVAWWFNQPTGDFMQALIDPRNKYITPGSLNDSPFLNDLLAPSNPMGEVFANVVVGTGGKTGRDIVKDWISADCPTPPKQKGQRKILWLSTSQNVWDEHPDPKIRGLGAIH